jgi:small subunit ribosomal protein S2
MKPYIFCSRNSIHIINVKETIKGLLRSKKFLASVVASGKDVLFVGTKRQARQPIVEQSGRCQMPYVSERWLGGTLTNFATIRKRLVRLEELEAMDEKGLMAAQSKKMESTLRREMRKIKRNLEGIREMNKLPGALIIIDARREHLAIAEARKLKIPTICLLDTDSDPDLVDIPIPGNDDAMRVIGIVTSQLTNSILEGKSEYKAAMETAEATEATHRVRSRRVSTAQAAEQIIQEPENPKVAPRTDTPQKTSRKATSAPTPPEPADAGGTDRTGSPE